MKTISINLYSFDELSEKAKQKAIEQCRPTEIFWADENKASMEAFADLFPIKVTNWSYGGRGEGVDFHFTADREEIEELNGQRLATYLWNNYENAIYDKKYYILHKLGLTDNKVIHNRVRSIQIINNCPNKGKWSNSYYSAITIQSYDCPLTGYCMDNELLDQIWKFIDKPDSRNFKDLLEDCFNAWVKACNDDIDYSNSDEAIIETIESNEYTFEENGKMRNG